MPACHLFSGVAALALAPANVTSVPPAETASEQAHLRAEIMPLFRRMQAAANVHDADAHLAYYMRGPSLTFIANGTVIRGWDNLVAQQRTWWSGGKMAPTDQAHQPYRLIEGPVFQSLGPGIVMLTFVLNARRIYPDRVTRRSLAVSQLWEKRCGWTIVYAHESAGPEQPAN